MPKKDPTQKTETLPPRVERLPSGLLSKHLHLPNGSRPRISGKSLKELGEMSGRVYRKSRTTSTTRSKARSSPLGPGCNI
jgi:hypothetical protein